MAGARIVAYKYCSPIIRAWGACYDSRAKQLYVEADPKVLLLSDSGHLVRAYQEFGLHHRVAAKPGRLEAPAQTALFQQALK